jgi:hypothetical protein
MSEVGIQSLSVSQFILAIADDLKIFRVILMQLKKGKIRELVFRLTK